MTDVIETTEQRLGAVLAGIMGVEQVSADSHFFEELGADSMVMTRFCARVRKQADLPSVSIKDVYKHPTISGLAAALTNDTPTPTTEQRLSEVLADIMGVEQVSVDSHFFEDLGADSMMMARFCARVRKQADLPPVSIKEIYKHPTISSLTTVLTDDTPTPTTEQRLSEVLADIMGVEQVSVDSHFFEELGADSMVMARFCARVRKQADLPPVSIKEVYEHPTISSLAAALADAPPDSDSASNPSPTHVMTPVGTPMYFLCGALQLLSLVGYVTLSSLYLAMGYEFIFAGSDVVDIYIRTALVSGVGFLGMSCLPILAKWILIGRWKPQQIRIWSLGYVRFWVVKTLIQLNPLVLFVGSPIYVLYLRALGAKIGRDVVIMSRHVPACTDLLTIGDNVVILKDSYFTCYRAQAGLIQTGSVTLGKDSYIGEMTVLDIDTSLGAGAQLGHSSALHVGQSIPDGEHRCGTPAEQKTDVDYRAVSSIGSSTLRKVVYSTVQMLNHFALLLPVIISIMIQIFIERMSDVMLQGAGPPPFSNWPFYSNTLIISLVLYFGAVLIGLVFVCTFPRLLNLTIKPNKDYPLYGFRHWAHRLIARLTNVGFLNYLFGDTSYILHYLSCLGYDVSFAEQTGLNFGLDLRHETPYHISVDRGMMAADGLSIINVDYSSTSFRISPVAIGSHCFFGNYVAYPSQGKTGNNCLFATKVMIPVDGEVREDVGLLGSPSFEIPRMVLRDHKFDYMSTGDEKARRLAAKNRHNIVTMAFYLLKNWGLFFGLILLARGSVVLYPHLDAVGFAVGVVLMLLFRFFYNVLVERASIGFRDLQPLYCSIYDSAFWPVERYWKLSWQPFFLNGTPFKNLAWRLLGVKIGKRVFDDGCLLMDKTMITIGDDCVLNVGSIVQPHSQEDGVFKSDRITIGAGCTIGIGALVHYGVTMGDGAQLAADTFLMKGEEVPPHTSWGENPAREIQDSFPVESPVTPARRRRRVAGNLVATLTGGKKG